MPPRLLFAGLLVAMTGLAACASTVIRDDELLDRPLPESYFLPNPRAQVWQAVIALASRPEVRVLVRDPDLHLLSWISAVEEGSPLHASLADPRMAAKGKVMAITFLRAEDAPGGCRLVIHQAYFPTNGSSDGASLSRGTYEQVLIREISQRLQAGG